MEGELSDHYDAAHKVLRLSPKVYAGRSLAAVGIAAHEAGHAIQDATRYPGLVVRSKIVPLASIGSTFCWLLVLAGLLVGMAQLVLVGDRFVFAGSGFADHQFAGRIQREPPGPRDAAVDRGDQARRGSRSSAGCWMRRHGHTSLLRSLAC